MNFVEHKTKKGDKGSVWHYFLIDSNGSPNAKCKLCHKILKTSGGSTKGLLKHITCVHLIKLQKTVCDEPQRKIKKIADFGFLQHEDTFPAVISRLIALDGLPFSLFITSKELRKSLQARGFDVPKSKETIKSKFLEFYSKCKENMKEEICKIKTECNKFSITFDEWTSI
ncbi:uncharacterized protein LOC124419943 [Lucilia cuprina]|uniref:uncharacterized protein LOC124419943 n=1 Tax=Lucilia cuprina TaxID=7375 RepID=UPI001F053891|nr:uncharacterized protein LOC124419943 [Lucilia cuprina]